MNLLIIKYQNYSVYVTIQLFISKMSFFGVQLNAQLNRLYLEIRIKLSQTKYQPNFRTIYRSFATMDSNISGFISPTNFDKCLRENFIYLKVYEIQVFQKAFKSQSGSINWFQFLQHLRQPMGPVRRQLVEKIFESMDKNKTGKLKASELWQYFNPNQFDNYKKNLKSKQQLFESLLNLFSSPDGSISKQQFIAFYDDCNINFHHNDAFIRFVSNFWHYTPEKQIKAKQQEIKAVSKQLRSKLIQKSQSTHDDYLLRKLFEEFDLNHNYSLGPYQLDLMLKKLKIGANSNVVDPLLQKMDSNRSGYIEYEQFKKYLFTDPYPI